MADWQVIATFVNAAVGLAVAWQAWETRNTAKAGNAAVETSQRGVKASQEGVDAARDSVRVSQALAIDATKARLDARAPKLIVMAQRVDKEGVFEASQYGEDQPARVGQTYRRTQDDNRGLVTGGQIDIRNAGDRDVKVAVGGPTEFLRPAEADVYRGFAKQAEVWLKPNESLEFRVVMRGSVQHWADAWTARERERTSEAATTLVTVGVNDPYDEGVIDVWDIECVSYPIEPVQGDLAAWAVRSAPADPQVVTLDVRPLKRRYYLSKRQNRLLES